MKRDIKKMVRIGKVEDQDRWRREDCARMTPNERLNALVDFRYRSFPEEMKSVKKVVAVRRLPGCSTDA
jgi:hypothetical protein